MLRLFSSAAFMLPFLEPILQPVLCRISAHNNSSGWYISYRSDSPTASSNYIRNVGNCLVSMTSDQASITSVNDKSVENLIEIFKSIYSKNNLLVVNERVSTTINFLTPFLRLKDAGKFDKLVKYEQHTEWEEAIGLFDGLIVVVDEESQRNDRLAELSSFVDRVKLKTKVHLVVQNLSKLFIYQFKQLQTTPSSGFASSNGFGVAGNTGTAGLVEPPAGAKHIRLPSSVKLYNWESYPLLLGDGLSSSVYSLEMKNGGLDSYFEHPVEHISKLATGFIQLLHLSPEITGSGKLLKLQNIYAKGDHASLLVKILQNDKIPDFLNKQLSTLEQQFYESKLKGNTDLIVLDRNLDYLSVAFNQLNYQGLIDDLFDIEKDQVKNKISVTTLQDSLYNDLQDLNFAMIGSKLNQLARYIQFEFLKKDNMTSMSEVRALVNNIGPLTNKQELIKKHTEISEAVLNYMKNGNASADPKLTEFSTVNEYEVYLEFQNDLFDMDYKQQLAKIKQFTQEMFSLKVIVLSVVLVSAVNDGIKERDYDAIVEELIQNFGLEAKFLVDQLSEKKVIKVVSSVGMDFLSVLTLRGSTVTPEADIGAGGGSANESEYSHLNSLGISGGQSGVKGSFAYIDKFLNLHPTTADEVAESEASKDGSLLKEYPAPWFALPSSTVPVLTRLVESLYIRDFLVNRPVNNLSRRPNWDGLGLGTMFHGKSEDINICDTSDDKKKKGTTHSTRPPVSSAVHYVVLIVVGGVTRSEISCIKYLEQRLNQDKTKVRKKFVILSSGIVNGQRLLDSCM